MSRRGRLKLLAGGAVIALALGWLIYEGVSQSAVYFVTPSELVAAPVPGKAYRLGGLVAAGSVRWEPQTVRLTFDVTDGKTTVPVQHRGTPRRVLIFRPSNIMKDRINNGLTRRTAAE